MSFLCRVLFAISLASIASFTNADSLTTIAGKQLTGELVAVDGQGVTFSTNEIAQLKVPAKEIHLIDLGHPIVPPPKDTKYNELELTDGSTFRIAKFAIKGKKIATEAGFKLTDQVIVALKSEKMPESVLTKLTSLKNKEFSRDDFEKEINKLLNADEAKQFQRLILNHAATDLLPGPSGLAMPTYDLALGSVFSIMRGAEESKNRDAWKKMLANRGKRDLYVIREAEGLNFVSGTILNGNEAGDILTFEKEDGAKAELRLSRATGGLVFAHPQPTQIAPTLCKVFDVFGNVLVAQSLEISSSGVVVTTVNGVVVKYPSSKAIAKLDYSQGNVAYLSDLDPQVEVPEIGVDEKGLRLNVTAPFIKNRSLSNEPLKLGSEVFPRGLSIAPDSKLTFNIGGDYREFKAVVGVQENSPDADLEARLTIETEEGRILFSEVLKRKDKPKSVGLDVKGVKQIRVIVEADLPVNGNRVILADARVQK